MANINPTPTIPDGFELIAHSATWCGPCRKYIPAFIEAVKAQYPELKVTVRKYAKWGKDPEDGEVPANTVPAYLRGFPTIELKAEGSLRGALDHPHALLNSLGAGDEPAKLRQTAWAEFIAAAVRITKKLNEEEE